MLLQVFLFESAAKAKVLRTREGSSFDFDLLGGGTCCARQGNNLSEESAKRRQMQPEMYLTRQEQRTIEKSNQHSI